MSPLRRLRMPLVVVAAFIVQYTILTNLHVDAAQPDLLVLLPIVAAMEGGSQRGAMVGFFVGVLADLYLQTPFGLSALTFTLVGYTVGLLGSALLDAAAWLTPAIAAAASAGAVVLYAVLYALLGHPWAVHRGLVAAVVVVAVVNGILAIPVARVVRWALDPGGRSPVPAGSALGQGRWGLPR